MVLQMSVTFFLFCHFLRVIVLSHRFSKRFSERVRWVFSVVFKGFLWVFKGLMRFVNRQEQVIFRWFPVIF